MSLEEKLITLLASNHSTNNLTWEEVAPFIDLTLLNEKATTIEIADIIATAQQEKVAAICVLPKHIDLISGAILNAIKRATVINFPTGEEAHEAVLRAIEAIITHHQADEIDYVFPYQTYLSGQQALALSRCAEVYQQCKQNNITFKVILETGALPSLDVIYRMSLDVIHSGCDFLKTSTGKIAQGASIPAAFALLSAIVDSKASCGIKISGGIRTLGQADAYLCLAKSMRGIALDSHWFRIGASRRLVD